jgi:hypothetical protein
VSNPKSKPPSAPTAMLFTSKELSLVFTRGRFSLFAIRFSLCALRSALFAKQSQELFPND